MSLYTFQRPEGLADPVLIAAFEGWVDAAGVGTSAAALIAAEGPVVASFDGDQLFDYRSSRPVVDFVDGRLESMTWPELSLRHRQIEGRHLLLLRGSEPDLQWRRFAAAVGDLAAEAGATEFVAIGSVPAPVPHTRPTPLMMTSPDPGLLDPGTRVPEGLLRVPAAALTVVSEHLSSRGLPARGFWVQVPQYVTAPFFQAVIALVERVSAHLGVGIPLGSLPDDAAVQRQHLDSVVASRPEARAIVERLEALVEQGSELPSAEEIGSQVERFLRDTTGGGEPFGSAS